MKQKMERFIEAIQFLYFFFLSPGYHAPHRNSHPTRKTLQVMESKQCRAVALCFDHPSIELLPNLVMVFLYLVLNNFLCLILAEDSIKHKRSFRT